MIEISLFFCLEIDSICTMIVWELIKFYDEDQIEKG